MQPRHDRVGTAKDAMSSIEYAIRMANLIEWKLSVAAEAERMALLYGHSELIFAERGRWSVRYPEHRPPEPRPARTALGSGVVRLPVECLAPWGDGLWKSLAESWLLSRAGRQFMARHGG
jgi:hypothetical protein